MKFKTIAALMLACICIAARVQKAVAQQKNSLRAPANIKIDGKLTEWNGKLQNYSNHTQFYYTLSNDDKFLYLAVQVIHQEIIDRIMDGGITLTIKKSGKKNDPDGIHITYPVTSDHFRVHVKDAPKVKSGATAIVAGLDSFVNATNTRLEQKTKMIRVLGITGLDTLISVYNLDGIKAASAVDHQLRYNYELAVSLADLGMDVHNPAKFTYQVMINEVADTMNITNNGGGVISVVLTDPNSPNPGGQDATDFWGEYILAK